MGIFRSFASKKGVIMGSNIQLQPVDMASREFLIQGFAVAGEFGNVIPWLHGFDELLYATNVPVFIRQMMDLTRQDRPIVPYQFIDSDELRTYLGGVWYFPVHPERFRDVRNAAIAERLSCEGDAFITCLQVRPPHRAKGIGDRMMRTSLRAIHSVYGSIWGVVSDPRVIPWHQSTGAELLSSLENGDDLWIVRWQAPH